MKLVGDGYPVDSIVAQLNCRDRQLLEVLQERSDEEDLREKMSKILDDTANALHGGRMENGLWSWHDLAELTEDLRNRLDTAEAKIKILEMSNASLEMKLEAIDNANKKDREDIDPTLNDRSKLIYILMGIRRIFGMRDHPNPATIRDCTVVPAEVTHCWNKMRDENDKLRVIIAKSELPCLYCKLDRSDMAKCRSGFPGCARADDLMLGDDL